MVERLVILASPSAADQARAGLEAAAGRLLAKYGDRVWVVELPPDTEVAFASQALVTGVFPGVVPDTVAVDDEAGRLGLAAWNLRQSPAFDLTRRSRRGEGRAWDDEGMEPEG
jgi:hypothetical protein